MKKLFLFVLLCLSKQIYAQVETFVGNLPNPPSSIATYNNFLYVSLQSESNSSIVKYNLNDIEPAPELVLENIRNLTGLAVYNDILLIAEWGNHNEPDGKIYQMNFSNEGSITQIAENLIDPNKLKVHDNYLYFSDTNGYYISRIDLSGNSFEMETVVSYPNSVNPFGVEIYDNYLYYIEIESIDGLQIFRLKRQNLTNLNEPSELIINVSDSILSRPIGLHLIDNHLLISDIDLNAIFTLNLTDNNQIEMLVDNLNGVIDCEYIDGDLYMVEFDDFEISVLRDVNLSTQNHSPNQINIYPNPTTGYVYFPESCYHMDYEIFDMKGKLINHGRINSLGYINLSTLPSGIYLIKLENQFVNKIIKN